MSTVTKKKAVKKNVQLAVDEYLQYHSQLKALEAKLKELREVVEDYMEQTKAVIVMGSNGGAITRTPVERPTMNAKYTTYDPDVVEPMLSDEAKKQCIVKRVDKDILEALSKLGAVDPSVLQMKIVTTSYQLRVK